MKFLEKNLEDIIYKNLQTAEGREKLLDKGLYTVDKGFSGDSWKVKRQVNFSTYGIADIIEFKVQRIGSYKNSIIKKAYHVDINIYELKKDKIDKDSLLQVLRYKAAVQDIIDYMNARNGIGLTADIDCILIGNQIEKGDMSHAAWNLDKVTVCLYNYDIDGLRFHFVDRNHFPPTFNELPYANLLWGMDLREMLFNNSKNKYKI
jgi:hypothetical protein